MFTTLFREDVRKKIINRAKDDKRIVSAAVIGSYANGRIDRWSDIDLTFGVDELYTTKELLDSWTEYVVKEFSGNVLFDVHRENTIYRVFILPGCLQLDLSFSPESNFGAIGPHFVLVFGKQYEKPQPVPPSVKEMFGYIVHHILRARISMERGKFWQAAFWVGEARNYALKLACVSRGLRADYGRGFDDLPNDIHSLFKDSFVKQPGRSEILRAIKVIIAGIPNISQEVNGYAATLADFLEQLSPE